MSFEKRTTASNLNPPCRKGPVCAIIESRHQNETSNSGSHLMVFGGQVTGFAMRNDTWFHSTTSTSEDWRYLVQKHGTGPTKRWKGSLVYDPASNGVYHFAGSDVIAVNKDGTLVEEFYNDLWKFDTTSFQWELIQESNPSDDSMPPPRRAHTAVVIDGKMIIFGGRDTDDVSLKDTWIYDIASGEYSDVSKQAPFPGEVRKGHSASVYDNEGDKEMIIYGGRINDVVYLGDAFSLSTTGGNLSWTELFSLDNAQGIEELDFPQARNHHSSVVFQKKLIVYGGRSNYTDTTTHSKLWIFDLENHSWSFVDGTSVGSSNFNEIASRMEHCAEVVNDEMLVFGGQDTDGYRMNDLVSMNLTRLLNSSIQDGKLWKVITDNNCAAHSHQPSLLGWYILAVVIVLGICLVRQRYIISSRHYSYRQI